MRQEIKFKSIIPSLKSPLHAVKS